MKQPNLVLVRHGESVWNKRNLFTGWVDVGLSAEGKKAAEKAGRLLRTHGFVFDRAYISVLKRSPQTLNALLKGMGLGRIPVEKSWRLNERHYGALQGLDKTAVAEKYGMRQLLAWRRGYSTPPPSLVDRSRKTECTAVACGLKKSEMPLSESLKDTYYRVIPFWKEEILPALKRGERVLVVAHGNSLRALVKYLEKINSGDIASVEIPWTAPLCYHVDKKGHTKKGRYLK